MSDYPDSKFDADGNLHVIWADLRFDVPGGFVEREVFYEQGSNIDNTYSVTFNVTETDQTTPIEDAEVTFYSITQNTSSTGETVFEYILAGTYPWSVSKTGYDTETGNVTVSQNETIEISLSQTVSINKLSNIDINIYPNPTDGIFNIYLPEDINDLKVIISDIIGKIVHQQFLNEKLTTINLNVKPGIYLIKFIHNNKSVISKINIIN